MKVLLPIATLLAAGCSADFALNEANGLDAASSDTTGNTATEPIGPPDTGDDTDEPEPMFWSLRGDLRVIGGQVEVVDSLLEIDLWSDELALLCTLEVPLTGAQSRSLPTTSQGLFSWWSIDHDEGFSDIDPDCGVWDAGNLELGIGPYEPQLDPALDARELLDSDVYGLYLRASPEEPVYVVGYAGTNGQLLGYDDALTMGPLTDADYAVEAVVVLGL